LVLPVAGQSIDSLDPDSSWKDMKRAGRKLFQALGELLEMQAGRLFIG